MRRRDFVRRVTIGGAVAALGVPRRAAAEPPLETTTLKLTLTTNLCLAPLYVAEELLPAEGFVDVRRVSVSRGTGDVVAAGRADISLDFIGPVVMQLDAGASLLVLAGAHVGCHEVFAGERVRSLADLKGKTVAAPAPGSGEHIFFSIMLASVGLDPRRDVTWLFRPVSETTRLLAAGEIDAIPAGGWTARELQERRIGRRIVNTAADPPWSQQFCCVVVANREFVRRHPVATKRALRAILKGADLCAVQTESVVQALVERGYTARRGEAVRTLKEYAYGKWREYDAEETMRFTAAHLREAGMIKSSPQKLIAQGTDWQFLNELKKELKG